MSEGDSGYRDLASRPSARPTASPPSSIEEALETVQRAVEYCTDRLPRFEPSALDTIRSHITELERENVEVRGKYNRLYEDGIMGRDTAYRRRAAAEAELRQAQEALRFIAKQHPAGCEADRHHWACGVARRALTPNPSTEQEEG